MPYVCRRDCLKSGDTFANQEPNDHHAYPEEFLTGVPPFELNLKIGAVMKLR
jgi:hypothetical protein